MFESVDRQTHRQRLDGYIISSPCEPSAQSSLKGSVRDENGCINCNYLLYQISRKMISQHGFCDIKQFDN